MSQLAACGGLDEDYRVESDRNSDLIEGALQGCLLYIAERDVKGSRHEGCT